MKISKGRGEVSELDITPMIDCVFQLIMFFMVTIALVVVVGIAIKFPEAKTPDERESKEKTLSAFITKDKFDDKHRIIKDGILKICGKDVVLSSSADAASQAKERKAAYKKIESYIDTSPDLKRKILDIQQTIHSGLTAGNY